MLKSDAAAYLAGVTQVEGAQASAPTNLHVITGEVGQKSEDGKTTVSVDGLVFSEEDSQEIEMDTLGGLEEGDIATIILTGEAGHGMTPLAIGAVGSVDRINAKVIETQLLLADKADIQDLTAATARIDDLEADHVTVNDFTAATGRIGDLEADNVTINGRLQAAELDIDGIQADYLKAADLQAEQARVGNLLANKADVSDLTAATGRISDLEADHVSVDDFEAATGRIDDLEADHIGTSDLQAEQARVDNLLANKASVSDLNAAKGRISDLEADHVTVADFQAEQANIDTLQANTADIAIIRANSAKVQNLTAAQLEADHATVGSLSTTYATVANLNAANGRITNLESTKANISDLEADYITADVIEATYMHANMSNSDVAWIENGTIKNGAIVSAMINDVSANKLTAGTINGSVINVTNLNADNITTGTINGQRIGEGSLSLSKLDESVYTEAEVNNIVDGLNDRIDGAIETFTGTAVPTLNNSPASSWNTTKLRDEHVGDVYYVVNSQSQQNGYCYRFTKSGSNYSWQLIKDSDVTAALSRLTTAEGKITTFDSDISTLKTDTGTLTTKTESLETSLGDKVDVTTFNDVSDTVDQHSQTISQMSETISSKADGSTVTSLTNRVSKNEQDITGVTTTLGEIQNTLETKADGSTVETVSNRLNTVSNTVDGHTQTLTNVQNTLEAKADGSTVSTLQEDYATYKQTTTENVSSIGTRLTTAEGKISTAESNITQNATNINAKVSKNDVINQINLSTEGVLIDADRVEINGTAVFNAIKSSTDAAYDAKGAAATVQSNLDNLQVGGRNYILNSAGTLVSGLGSAAGSKKEYQALNVGQSYMDIPHGTQVTISFDLYMTVNTANPSIQVYNTNNRGPKAFSYAPVGDGSAHGITKSFAATAGSVIDERVSVTGYINDRDTVMLSDNFLEFYSGYGTSNWFSISNIKLERGNKATDWTPAPEDTVSRTQRIYYRWNSATAPAAPTTWVTKGDDGSALWTKMHVAITSTHKYIYTCEQYEMADGTLGHTDVLLDNTITVIDGGNIITGSVTANKLNAADINASKTLTIGAFQQSTQDAISNDKMSIGGRNLLRRSYYQQTTTKDGITCTNNGDGSVTINGTTTATPTVYYFDDSSASSRGHVTLEAGTYTLSGCPDGGGDGTWRLDMYGIPTSSGTVAAVDYCDGVTFTTTGGTPTYIRMRFPSGITLNNFTVWPKLEKGNKATDWTPAPEDTSAEITEISDAVSAIPSYVVKTSNYVYTYDRWKTYAAEGHTDSWSTITGVKVGDTVLIKGTVRDTQESIYVLVTVNAVSSSGAITNATSHGFIDPTAGERASNYITTIDTTNGIKIANASPSSATTYLQLASNFLDFIRGGVSMLKAWVDGTTAKVRLGCEAAAHIVIDSGSIGMLNGENEIFSLVGSETVHEDTSSTTTSDVSTMSVGNGEYGKASMSFERYHYESEAQDSYRNDIELGVDTDNDGINNTYFRLTDVIDTDSSSSTPQGSAKLKANYLALENDSTDGFYTMQNVMDVLGGGVTLYDNESASASATATLNESAANFRRLTIFYKDQDNTYGSVDVWNPNGKRVSLDLTWINGTSTQQMYQRVRWVTISGTTISTFKNSSDANYRTGQVRLGGTYSVTNSDYISIVHVIGYR